MSLYTLHLPSKSDIDHHDDFDDLNDDQTRPDETVHRQPGSRLKSVTCNAITICVC